MANKTTNKKPIEAQKVEVEASVEAAQENPSVAVKRILYSKTIWMNLLAFLAFAIEKRYGFIIDPDLQMQALTLINIALRFVTKEPIAWGGEDGTNKETS
jgi:hypothetical protein